MTGEDDKTANTMWSESLIEGLYIGIAKSGNDNALRELIKELKEKGYDESFLINKVNTNVSLTASKRLQALLGRGGANSTASSGKKEKKGMFSKMFGK
jgi:hypothetical protein